MQITNHFSNAQGYIREHWPIYLFGYGGGTITSLVIIWLSVTQGWYSFIIIAFALLVLLLYLFLASVWAAGYTNNIKLLRDTLFDLGSLQPEDSLVQVCLGRRYIPASFCRRLTTGQVLALDTYNPQLVPGRPLARVRQQAEFLADPRLSWRDGSTNLLPLPDASVSNIVIVHTASEYWQQGDQEQLFSELFRILAPGGQLLMAESIRSPTSVLTFGFSGLRLHSARYWEAMLVRAGFRMSKNTIIKDLIYCWRFERPLPDEPVQLLLEL